MLKNTDKKMTIKSMSKGKRVFLTSGVVLTSLCLSLPIKASTKVDNAFNNYAGLYLNSSEEINKESFDPIFEEFYNTGIVNINDNDYEISDIYIKTMDDDKNYLTKAGEKTDLITMLPLTGKKKESLALKKASFLYDLYEDGYIDDNVLKIDNEKLEEYLTNWDRKEHSEVKSLKIEQEANKEYHKKYGKSR